MSSPVWLITGASNGLGLSFCLRALKAGHKVIGAMRNLTRAAEAVKAIESQGGQVMQLDMTESQSSIKEKVQAAEKIYGKIDVLVNNAGYSLLGPLSEFTEKEVTTQMQTNFFGPLYAIQAVLPGMRARKSGTIVNISSIAGQDALPTCSLYAGSKFALEGLSESLSREVAGFGIDVLIVEPGAFRTNFLRGSVANEKGLPEHEKDTPVGKTMQKFNQLQGAQRGDPDKLADRVFEVVTGEGEAGALKGKILRLPLGKDCLDRLDAKISRLKSDVEASRTVAESTDL
ncbi:NAD(P)-binding protein [Daldinia caldariorum]|uniref:NAD(P)-binding protein n=1 Tax=Daldinia caldariorum TaxID=326644 RepID=UPI002008E782|nr:NAD(P)-binding protein [Daldinia caldariorum]KAI1465221.1 NAD(P)-binding protein [Daldinia caldariorum]